MEIEEDALRLMNHQAKWHKRCHQKFNNAKLERVDVIHQILRLGTNKDETGIQDPFMSISV